VLVHLKPDDLGTPRAAREVATALAALPGLSQPGTVAHLLGRTRPGASGLEAAGRLAARLRIALWAKQVRIVEDVELGEGSTVRLDLGQGRILVADQNGTPAYDYTIPRRRPTA